MAISRETLRLQRRLMVTVGGTAADATRSLTKAWTDDHSTPRGDERDCLVFEPLHGGEDRRSFDAWERVFGTAGAQSR